MKRQAGNPKERAQNENLSSTNKKVFTFLCKTALGYLKYIAHVMYPGNPKDLLQRVMCLLKKETDSCNNINEESKRIQEIKSIWCSY